MLKQTGIFNPDTKAGKIYKALTMARRWVDSRELANVAGIRPLIATSSFVSDVRAELKIFKPNHKLVHKQEDGTHYYRIIGPSGR